MSECIVLKEYEKFPNPENEEHENCCFSDFKGLEKFLDKNNLSSAISFTASGLKADSWVGVIKYKNTTFQILPKLIYAKQNKEQESQEEQNNHIIKNLIFMLSYTRKLEIKTIQTADLDKCKNPFLEVLIREYAVSLFEALKRITPKNYNREEDNLNFLRGKIKFSENIRYNAVNQAKFYCEFDEFSENNLLNQLFLFVSTCLYNISSNSKNKSLLKLIIDYFCEIKLVKFDKFKVNKIILTRNQQLFKKSFVLAKIFIENSSIDLSSNKLENIALIWDMNKLFEEFIYEVLKRKKSKLKVNSQEGRKLLYDIETNKQVSNTYVDIFVEFDNGEEKEKIVLDTKYKKIEGIKDVKNADIFQVCTYCLIHNSKKSMLIYPKSKEDFINLYRINCEDKEEEYLLKVVTVDLLQENLKDKIEDIAKKLEEQIINIKPSKEKMVNS